MSHSPLSPVVVTGAGSGIGRACAEALAEAGRPVALWDIDQGNLDMAWQSIREKHDVPAVAVLADLAEPEQIRRGVTRSRAALGALGGLVHAAGVDGVCPLEDLTPDAWSRVLDINLRAELLLIQTLLPDLKALQDSAIVGVASINATLGNRMNPAYSASKGGMLSLTRALADELAQYGIRMNTVSPGQIETPMLMDGMAKAAGQQARFERHILLGRLGQPREVAKAVRFLLSHEASYITATELVVDGGNLSSQRY